jgi:hypothetical protein
MMAILLTHIVEQALTDSTTDWFAFVVDCVGVLLSGAYLFVLSRISHLPSGQA